MADESDEDLKIDQVLEGRDYSLFNVYIFVGIVLFFVICICLLQEYANRRYDRRQTERQLRTESEQLAMQVSIAKQDQKLQEERRRKYLCFLRPSYTMVVTESDFTTEEHGDSSLFKMGGTMEEQAPASHLKQNKEDCDLDLGQLEASRKMEVLIGSSFACLKHEVGADNSCRKDEDKDHQPVTAHPEANPKMEYLPMVLKQDPVLFSVETDETTSVSDDDDEYQHGADLELGRDEELVTAHARFLCLPVTDNHGNLRKVDAECSICIMEYNVGDEVVWSTRRSCRHAFHSDCILLWLSKGKKRCPICRHFFVPGQRVDDKEVIVQDETSD